MPDSDTFSRAIRGDQRAQMIEVIRSLALALGCAADLWPHKEFGVVMMAHVTAALAFADQMEKEQ